MGCLWQQLNETYIQQRERERERERERGRKNWKRGKIWQKGREIASERERERESVCKRVRER